MLEDTFLFDNSAPARPIYKGGPLLPSPAFSEAALCQYISTPDIKLYILLKISWKSDKNQKRYQCVKVSLVCILVWGIYCRLSTFPTIPSFPYFYFVLLLFPTFFLKMPYYPYFLIQKCLNWPKIIFFPHSLGSLIVSKNQINLIWAATLQKFIKYFYFSCKISFFGTFILVFPFRGSAVLLFRENFVC